MEQSKEDRILKARIEDKIRQASEGYYAVSTGFLDSHEQGVARALIPAAGAMGVNLFFYGGYADADRSIAIAVPADLADNIEEAAMLDEWVVSVRASVSGGRQLTHRDYLGSLLGLGLERSVIGDILVRPDGADILIKPEIKSFLMSEYDKAGRSSVNLSEISLSDLMIPEQRTKEISCTVSSARLDNIVAAAFGLSRGAAAEAIGRGLVSVDHSEVSKPDRHISPGQTIVLKGKGKAVYKSEEGVTKKGKLAVRIVRYL